MIFGIAIAIFAVTYALIVSEKVHRTVVALSGAALMIILGILTQEQAVEGVDFNTLGLLIGMMLIVGIAKHSGMFQYVALTTAKWGQGRPVKIFLLLCAVTAVFSALLDNVTTVLLIVPVAIVIAHNLNITPKPFFIGAILLSNLGGAATLIGDPPNILIGSAADIDFTSFLTNMGPLSLICSATTMLLLYFWYRKQLVTTPEAQEAVMNFKPKEAITDKKLLIKSLIVIGLVLLSFFFHSWANLEPATIAMAGAALLLLLTLKDPEDHLKDVEWPTIFFFIGLFMLVAGLEHVGALELLAGKLLDATGGNPTITTLVILWGSAVASAIIDNIPFVATMIPLIKDIGILSGISLMPLWWALAIGADIGGNATLVGASANVIVSGMAEKEGHRISFGGFMKVAAPLTLISMLIATAYVWLRYLN